MHAVNQRRSLVKVGEKKLPLAYLLLLEQMCHFLGKIPFAPELRTGGDSGAPIVHALPDSLNRTSDYRDCR